MLFTLENDFLSLTASNKGAELHSVDGKKENTSFLWNGNEDFWKYHAPILFPIVGKVVDNKYSVNGSLYELPQHGLGRISNFELIEKNSNSLIFELNYNEDTLKVYPFKFSLQIRYTLINNSIKIDYIVKNIDNKKIFFSIGAHPAFMCPLKENETMEDYYFEFNKKETASLMLLNEQGYFSHKTESYLKDSNIIQLSKDLFKNDALIFSNLSSNKITLKSKNHSKSISMDFTGFPYMALWSKPTGAPFVCIEPWFGHSDYYDFKDDFSQKEGIESLDIKDTFTASYTVTFNE